MNVLSVINYIIQTCFEKKTDETSQDVMTVTEYLEIIFSYYFLSELILFLYKNRRHILKSIFSFDFLIDFVTIFPPIISSFLDNRLFRFQFIRVLRIFRVFRILRIYKTLKIIQIENSSVTAEDDGAPKLNPIKLQFYTILVILFCNFFICAGLVLGLNDLIVDAFSKPDMNFFDSFYFVIVTSSTLGYGDIVPTNPVTRFLVIASLFSLVLIVSNQVSKLSLILRTWGPSSAHYKLKDHLILVMDSSINYIYVLQSLQTKYEHKDIIIISKEELCLASPLLNQNRIKLIHVLDYDLEAFDRANIKSALALLIFTEKVTYFFDQKEKIIDFLLLKLHRFYSEVPIYLQTLFSDRSSFTTNNGKIVRFKKIIPIMKIKSLIESKSLFNPGFACFIQNLIFNDTKIPDDYETYNPLMKNYFFGTENEIVIKKFPEYFCSMQFSEAVYIVYLKSIAEHFVKIQTDNKNSNRGILLIGIKEKNKFNIYDKEEVKIFPEKYIIKPKSQGVFISYNGLNYVEKFLAGFDLLKEQAEVQRNDTENKPKGSNNSQPVNLDLFMDHDPERIAKKNFYRRSAIIDTINNSIFKISNVFVHEKPYFNLHPGEVINEKEEENSGASEAENKEAKLKIKKSKTFFNLKHANTIMNNSNNINKYNSANNNKNVNSQSKNSKTEDSFKNIKEEFCVEKVKRNSVTLRKLSNKYDSEIDFKHEGQLYYNYINTFLNKYDKKINNDNVLIEDEMKSVFKKQQSKSSFENESLLSNKKNKQRKKKQKIKNPLSTTKLKFFNEDSDEWSFENEYANATANKLSSKKAKIYSQTNLNKKIDSCKKADFLKDWDAINRSDVLILDNNKMSSNKTNLIDSRKNFNTIKSKNNYKQLEEGEAFVLSQKQGNNRFLDNCDKSNVSLRGSEHCSSNISSFISDESIKLNENDVFRLAQKNNKTDLLNQDAILKIDKLGKKDEIKHIDDNALSTKEKQISTKLFTEEVEEELKKIEKTFSQKANKKVEKEPHRRLNKSNESKLILSNRDKNFTNKSMTKSINKSNLNNIFDNFSEKSIKTNKNLFLNSAKNVSAFNKEENTQSRRQSLVLNNNFTGINYRKSFKEDFQNIQGLLNFQDAKSTRRLSLDENHLFKSNVSKLKRGSIFYTNNNFLKNGINKEDIKSFKSQNTSFYNNNNLNSEQNISGINQNNYYKKMQLLNSSGSVFEKNEEENDNKSKKSKKGIIYDKTKFKSKNTKRNLDFLNKFEHIYDKSITAEINKKNEEHYSELRNLVYKSTEDEYIFEHRIFELDKVNAQEIFSNHILIIGYQDALDKFVKLISYHFPNKPICFLGTEEQRDLICIKLLKQYKNVYFFQGDPINPFHLLNAGLNNANQVIILSENIFKKLNEDMRALLSSRLVDYYFDLNMLIELWDCKSAKLLGYIPLDKKANDITNEFYHPLFMSGKLIYLSHLDKLTTLSVTDPNVIETLYQIISVGFRKFVNNFANRRTDINMRLGGDVPVVLTIDLPEHYWGREYYVLVQDLLTLEKPAIPLGLYISDPLGYHLLDSQGKISQSQKNHFWKIINSHKRKLINLDSMGRFESAYFNNMKFLREISYTDKIVLNYVDLKRTHLPIFITNPLPGFILSKDCKVLIMTNYAPNLNNLKEFRGESKKEMSFKNKNEKKKKEEINDVPIDDKIRECQEKYIKLLDTLNKQFSSNYIEALKNAEKIKKNKSMYKDKKFD